MNFQVTRKDLLENPEGRLKPEPLETDAKILVNVKPH